MRPRIRAAGALLATVLLAALLPAGTSASAETVHAVPIRPATPKPTKNPTVHIVTLITGDKVTVVDGKQATVHRGKGRAGVTFTATRTDGRLRVVPSDARPLVRAGRLDPELFDVTSLIEYGYHDTRKDVPLIVTGQPGVTKSRTSGLAGASASRAVPGGTALSVAKSSTATAWSSLKAGLTGTPSYFKVWLDRKRKPTLDQSVPQIGAPTAWAAGFTGTGVKVAIVDTGIDGTHPDIAGRVVAAQDFTGDGHTRDEVGHGTHVASTVGSSGGKYKGVAPDVQLISAKVCSLNVGCPDSAILAGMEWAAQQGAKVINMSLGGPDSPEQDPVEAAVESLTAQYGVLFVISAGNAGRDATIGSPGSADSALTVGAVDRADGLADFSSRGPRVGDAALKPDITAPGVEIVAALSKDSGGPPGEQHLAASGTSMAAPHVAGAAAILAQQHPTWTAGQLKAALMGSAKPNPAITVYGQGAGRVDVARAIGQTVLAEPASLSLGRQLWPHQDDQVITRTVTYRNLGTAAVTFDLSLSGDLPAGMFALSATTVTIPAAGTASVTLTADTRVVGPDGFFGGQLRAQAGDLVVTTPFAVDKEIESYDLTLSYLDRSGQPAAMADATLFDPETKRLVSAGAGTMRAPKGRYTVFTFIAGPGTGPEADNTLLVQQDLVVDRARTVQFDARTAGPVSVTPPQADAQLQIVLVDTQVVSNDGQEAFGFGLITDTFDRVFLGEAGPRLTNPRFDASVSGLWTKADVEPIDSPYLTQLAYRSPGRMFNGLTKRPTLAQLGVVDAQHARQSLHPGSVAELGIRTSWPGYGVFFGLGGQIRLPSARLEYHNADDGAMWEHSLIEGDLFGDGVLGNFLNGPPTAYAAGKRHLERRNRAVFSPGFANPFGPELWLTRRGNLMTLVPPRLNDQLNWFGGQTSGTTRLTLDRNGERIADEPFGGVQVEVAPGAATYRLGLEVTRGAPNPLSTKVSGVWTFRSDTVGGDKPVGLPASAVRFLPAVNQENAAPAGRLFAIPIEIDRHPGSAAGGARKLTVEVSYDDGATWVRAPVLRYGQLAVAFVQHPAGAGFVSLRGTSTDSAGNTVELTVLRAYAIA